MVLKCRCCWVGVVRERVAPRDEDTMFLLANCKSRGRLCRSVSSVLPLFALHTHRVDRGCSVRASIMELYC